MIGAYALKAAGFRTDLGQQASKGPGVVRLPKPGGKGVHHYDRPVIVLQDSGCFSATDIFLGAFEGIPGVTLLGVPSGGGSGRSRKVTLPRSGVRLRVSSMASFQPGGKLYDGNGVHPDVIVEPTPGDWIGRSDSMLDAAVARIRKAAD